MRKCRLITYGRGNADIVSDTTCLYSKCYRCDVGVSRGVAVVLPTCYRWPEQ